MQTLKVLSTLLLLAALSLSACLVTLPPDGGQAVEGSGTLAEETRSISGVTAVELAMPGTLHVEIGAAESLRVSAEDNLLAYIETNARGGELVIQTTPNVNLQPRKPIDYYLTVKALDTLSVTSSGNVEAADLQATKVSVSISSSGSVALLSLKAETLGIEITSSGNLLISGGEVQRQEIRISSSGEYMARDVQSNEADVRLSSSGSATIRVQDSIRADLSSSGNVYYLGAPQLEVQTSSSGKAIQVGY